MDIKVCSHKRSGTHLLLATLFLNFKFEDQSRLVKLPGQKWYLDGKEESLVPWANLFGTHSPYYLNKIPNENIIYIVRHPVSCLYSYWKFEGGEKPLDKFVTEELIRFWYSHTQGYILNCKWIKYEDLVGKNFNRVMNLIEKEFSLKRKQRKFIKVNKKVGWSPGESRLDYSDRFKPETLKLFRKIIPQGYLGYKF